MTIEISGSKGLSVDCCGTLASVVWGSSGWILFSKGTIVAESEADVEFFSIGASEVIESSESFLLSSTTVSLEFVAFLDYAIFNDGI